MKHGRRYRKMLEAAWDSLKEAEAHLLSLGHQLIYVRRICLERIKTAIAMATLALEYREISLDYRVRRHLELAEELLDVLEKAGGHSPFWQRVVRGQREELRASKQAWEAAALPAK